MDHKRIVNRVVAGVAVAVLASAAHTDTIYVDDDNCPGPGDGSEGNPYCSIQIAIDNALDTDEIVVADGTYTGYYNREIDFLGKQITVRSTNGPETCLIHCQDLGRGFHFHSGETADSVLRGFTILRGYAGGDSPLSGGGAILCQGASPTIADCIFRDCFARSDGGALYIRLASSPTVVNCKFDGNRVGDGWYIGFGGAMCNEGQSCPTITNCWFSGNVGEFGGAVCNYGQGDATLTNCTFYGNWASAAGDGIANMHNSNPTVTNCILWGYGGDEIWNENGSSVSISYSDVQGGWPGTGNIDADPTFVDPYHGDVHLSPRSPCIDAGDNNAVPEGITTDLDGAPRFHDDGGTMDTGNGDPPVADMGAYEFQDTSPPPCPADIDGDGEVGFQDFLWILSDWQGCSVCLADINCDGGVDVLDFLLLLANWGPCPH